MWIDKRGNWYGANPSLAANLPLATNPWTSVATGTVLRGRQAFPRSRSAIGSHTVAGGEALPCA
jgi:hypothetical protein